MDASMAGGAAPSFGRTCAGVWLLVAGAMLACTEPEPPRAERLAFVVEPATTTRAVPFSPSVQVEAQDANGNRVTSWNGTVFMSLGALPSGFDGARAVQAEAGLATFPDLAVVIAGTGFQLTAAGTGVRDALSRTFDIHAGPPARLSFFHFPTSGRVGKPLGDFVIDVSDAAGFRNTTDIRTITLALASSPPGATVAGTVVVESSAGLATFRDLSVDQTGDYSVRATAPGLSDAVGASFSIRPLFVSVSAGYVHSCGRAQDGAVYCWGDVGPIPVRVPQAPAFVTISSGRDTRCGLTAAGAAHCWDGQGPPVLVSSSITFAAVAAGYVHNCGVTANGVAYCWGGNDRGELGNGSFGEPSASPVAVSGNLTFAQVSPGRLSTCGITATGAAYCWGANDQGQLGTSTTEDSTVPVAVLGGHTFAAIGAGGWFSCGLTTAGNAYCWGSNASGELGNGTSQSSREPVAVAGGLKFTALSIGNRHACALTADGTAYCWGDNSTGMVGAPSGGLVVQRPTAVEGDRKFSVIRAGRFHTCGVASDGETYCWGSNNIGLLGSPGGSSQTPRLVP